MKLVTSVEELESAPNGSFAVTWGGHVPNIYTKAGHNNWVDEYGWDQTFSLVPAILITEEFHESLNPKVQP